jgi:hypothetical protein
LIIMGIGNYYWMSQMNLKPGPRRL